MEIFMLLLLVPVIWCLVVLVCRLYNIMLLQVKLLRRLFYGSPNFKFFLDHLGCCCGKCSETVMIIECISV